MCHRSESFTLPKGHQIHGDEYPAIQMDFSIDFSLQELFVFVSFKGCIKIQVLSLLTPILGHIYFCFICMLCFYTWARFILVVVEKQHVKKIQKFPKLIPVSLSLHWPFQYQYNKEPMSKYSITLYSVCFRRKRGTIQSSSTISH